MKVDRVVLGVLLVVMVLLSSSYGITYDEPSQREYGRRVLKYFASGFTDLGALTYFNLYLYGGMFDAAAFAAHRVVPWLDPYAVRHALNSAVAWVGFVYVYRLGRLLGGPRAGWVALGLLLASPMYFGHGMNNPKDIPFASFFVMSLYYLAVLAREFPKPAPRTWILVTVSIGLALNARVGGLILLCYLGALVALVAARAVARGERLPAGVALGVACVVPASIVLGTAFWPWAQRQPFTRPFVALRAMTHFEFGGSSQPWSYTLEWFGVTTPLVVLFGIVVALVMMPLSGLRWKLGALLLAGLCPLAYVIVRESVLYNGVRHLLFVYPPLVVCAAIALVAAHDRLRRVHARLGAVFALACAALAADAVVYSVRDHPHQTSYFNPLVGGTRGAFGRYELDYWAACYKQSVAWLDAEAARANTSFRVAAWDAAHLPRHYRSARLTFVPVREPHDYALTHLGGRPAEEKVRAARPDIVHRVEAAGVPLCAIFGGDSGARRDARVP
jgi:hypothetical protein